MAPVRISAQASAVGQSSSLTLGSWDAFRDAVISAVLRGEVVTSHRYVSMSREGRTLQEMPEAF